MKTVIIGDTHGRDVWKSIVGYEKADRVIFVGDYFDSFDIPYDVQINNFLDIVAYKESGLAEVILLIGNHDYHYLPYINDNQTSGYQTKHAHLIKQVIDNYKQHLQMAYGFDRFLVSHAGISSIFMNRNKPDWTADTVVDDVNQLFHYKPTKFQFTGMDPYGDDVFQTPIWIRPVSLKYANHKTELLEKYIQVFGHTFVKKIDTKGISTGGKYYAIDALETSGEYMIVTDGVISFNSYKNYVK